MSHSAEDASGETRSWIAPRYGRRPSDEILIAFNHACEHEDLEVAEQLLRVLEMMLARRTVQPDRRRRQCREELVAAQQLLWQLRHPDSGDGPPPRAK